MLILFSSCSFFSFLKIKHKRDRDRDRDREKEKRKWKWDGPQLISSELSPQSLSPSQSHSALMQRGRWLAPPAAPRRGHHTPLHGARSHSGPSSWPPSQSTLPSHSHDFGMQTHWVDAGDAVGAVTILALFDVLLLFCNSKKKKYIYIHININQVMRLIQRVFQK